MNCHFIQNYSNYSVFTTMIYGAQVIITITKKFLLFTNKIEEYVRPPDLSSPLCATDCSPKIALKSSIPKIQGFCCTQKETRLVEFELGRDRWWWIDRIVCGLLLKVICCDSSCTKHNILKFLLFLKFFKQTLSKDTSYHACGTPSLKGFYRFRTLFWVYRTTLSVESIPLS